MAAFSSAKSAYMRLSLLFSASSSRGPFTSDTKAPPYLLRHLKKVVLLLPCIRSRSDTWTPLSASFNRLTVWLSLNFDFLIAAPAAEQCTFGCQANAGAYKPEVYFWVGDGSAARLSLKSAINFRSLYTLPLPARYTSARLRIRNTRGLLQSPSNSYVP